MNTLVIDIGTSSMRGILFSETGKALLTHQIKYTLIRESGGQVEQPASEWTRILEEILREIAAQAAEKQYTIDLLAMTSQRSSIIPVDREGNALYATIMWQDSRNAGIVQEVRPKDDEIFQRCGAKANTVFSGSRMTWIKRNMPEVYEKLYKFVNIPEYLIYHMTGDFVSDMTYASRSNLFNLRERTWDPYLLELFEIREDQLCRLVEPGSVCGTITETFGQRTGIKAGTPLITCGGDQQCAAVGQGAYQEGKVSIVAGTGAFLCAASKEVPGELNNNLICNASAVAGEYIIEANVLTCCSAFDWFCKTFYDGDTVDYDRVNRDLEQAYEKDSSCLVLPFFQGRSTPAWNNNAKGTFSNITLATTREEILKGLLEGIFLEVKNNIDLFGTYIPIREAAISGGLTNSPIINQMQADIYGIPLKRMSNSESTALGALMVALVGQGVYTDMDAAFAAVRSEDHIDLYEQKAGKGTFYHKKQQDANELYGKMYS